MTDDEIAIQSKVSRVNKKPLFIGIAVLVGVIAIFAQAIFDSDKANTKAKEEPQMIVASPPAQNPIEGLGEGAKGVIPDEVAEAQRKAADDALRAQADEAAGEQTYIVSTPSSTPAALNMSNGIIPDQPRPTRKLSKKEIELAEKELDRRRMSQQAAIDSPMLLSTGIIALSGKAPDDSSVSTSQKVSTGQSQYLSSITNALEGRVQAMSNMRPPGTGTDPSDQVDVNRQVDKLEFSKRGTGSFGYNTAARMSAISPYELKSGTVIPCVLLTAINSDLPGMIVGQVSQDVYDSATGRYLLIPQGSRVVGTYDSVITFGQERALIAWNKLTFPDGSTFDLGVAAGVDSQGYAGFGDKVNRHHLRVFGSAIMVSLFSAGIQLSQPQKGTNSLVPTASEQIAADIGRQMGELGKEIAKKNLQVQPTIIIRTGYRFHVMLNKDMVLSPYAPMPTKLPN